MKIGNLTLKTNVFCAPMAGVTDAPFRLVCRKYFSGACVTEMVSAKAVCFCDKKTKTLAAFSKEERPIGIQIFGSEPEIMAKAAAILYGEFAPDFIDINMGCPAPKIVNNGEGSALMKDPALAGKIVYAVKNAIGQVPLTVKMRLGFDKAHINAPELAKVCESSGADAIFIHGRTREQMYMPSAEYNVIREIKSKSHIPVIANGDICCPDDALRVLEYTGCDGVMIGRASLGNPYVLADAERVLSGLQPLKITPEQKCRDMKEHMHLLISQKGEYVGVREARKHIAWYIKGYPGSAELRNRANCARTVSEIDGIIDCALLCFKSAFNQGAINP